MGIRAQLVGESLLQPERSSPKSVWRCGSGEAPCRRRSLVIPGLSPEEVQLRLAESRAKLLDAGIDLEALSVVEALPAPSDGGS
jgi:hypothetical protein